MNPLSGDNPQKYFLNTEKDKIESNAIEMPSISMPRGGGVINGIDENCFVNTVNSIPSFSFPFPFSPAKGINPSLSIFYNSGARNDIFGLDWSLGLSSIKRKTDKGPSQYLDSIDSSKIFEWLLEFILTPELRSKA